MNNSIELPVAEWKTAVTGLGKVISKRSTLPVLEYVRVTRDEAGAVTLQGTDLDATVSYAAKEPVAGRACDFLVPLAALGKALKGATESLRLIPETKSRVRLRTVIGNSPIEQVLETPGVDEFPPATRVDGPPIPVNEHFTGCLRQAFECCSDDNSRHVIQHVCLDTRPKDGHWIAASDGRHLFAANSFHFDLKEPLLIPNQPFLRWTKFMEDGNGELNVKHGGKQTAPWMQLKSGPWTFTGKCGEGEFPKWEQVVPPTGSTLTRVEFDAGAVDTLLTALPRLPGQDAPNRAVQLVVTGSGLQVRAREKDAKDWTTLAVDGVRITGKPARITLNRDYLMKALRFGLTTVGISDELSPLDFSNANRRMIVMPVRSDSTPPVPPQPTTPPQQSGAQPESSTMPKASETQTPPPETQQDPSPVKAVVQHIENIKDTLKAVCREFGDVLDQLKQLEKEKRASDREMETVRGKLREIQSVRL